MASEQKEKRRLEEYLLRQAAAARAGEGATTHGHDVSLDTADREAYDIGDEPPPPAYGEDFGVIRQDREGFGTQASVTDDGRVNISIDQRNSKISQLLSMNVYQTHSIEAEQAPPPPYIPSSLGGKDGVSPPPPMNVVIQIVGSRGDVQPFVALAKVLRDRYGHRVRLATHPNFKDFVQENGIEFFNIGGNPQGLMAFMVKNPGLMPRFDSLRAGDVGKRREEVAEYLEGCWRSCFETGDGFGSPVTDKTVDGWSSDSQQPFIADCIVANPPSFAHIHVAERLGIPLHIYFTMPYSPTQAFPHPLANIQASNADENLTNYISYGLVEMLTWQGLGDVINRFRKRSLGLDEVSLMRAPGMLQRLKIPHTYAWSPAMIPKPKDWGAPISIAGFFFLDLAKFYTPAPDLKAFLDAGPPPVYIGFGSIVLDDPNKMTKLIFDAVRKSGQRALVSKGWGGVGGDDLGKPDEIFMLGNVPHDWLFKHVSCVVHHGGAGTTSAGLTAGRPTLVVPFFGDQPFWGSMVARAGAGPEPIPSKKLTSDNLAEGIVICLQPQMQQQAHVLADKMSEEDGSEVGAQSFHQFLNVDNLRCNVAPSRAAVWTHKQTQTQLSAMVACTLAQDGLLDFQDLKLFRAREYDIDEGPWDPLSGGASMLIGTFSSMVMGVADLPGETVKIFKGRPAGKAAKNDNRADGRLSDDIGKSHGSTSSKLESIGRVASPKTGHLSSGLPSRTSSTSTRDILAAHKAGPFSLGADSRGAQLLSPASRSPSRQTSPTRGSGSETSSMLKAAATTGKGMNRIVGAGLKSPMEFSVNMAKGFHNAPKLYGDDTVRKSDKVSGWRSGLKVAGKEFGFGMYDGITGLITQPIKGATEEGGIGFLKGFGKGVGGFFFKPGAALFSIPAYSMNGLYKEIVKRFGSSVQNYIIAARIAQGFDEYQRASVEERRDVVMRWRDAQKGFENEWKRTQRHAPVHSTPNERTIRPEAGSQHNENVHMLDTARHQPEVQDPGFAMLTVGSNHAIQDGLSAPADRAQAPYCADNKPIRKPVPQKSDEAGPSEHARMVEGWRADVGPKPKDGTPSIDQLEDEQLRLAIAESTAEARRHQHQLETDDEELQRIMSKSLNNWKG
ncbi:UDP-Glycosyltransferase/glycogen phosphorylase [Hortaea werneckii]|nr:UDP-Glycosyltransferase/glycogen phosphorylase [Hortaea werneckii]